MPVLITRQAPGSLPVDSRKIKRLAERMLTALKLEEAELSLLLTNDARIRLLNRTHRGQDKPTDVLAFPLQEGPVGEGSGFDGLLGDVAISIDTAERQARDHGHSLLREVCFLLGHGLLHLLGYDHPTARDARTMNAKTMKLVAAALGNEH